MSNLREYALTLYYLVEHNKTFMKKLFIFLACAQAFVLLAQENPVKKIYSEVEQVTVFFANAKLPDRKALM